MKKGLFVTIVASVMLIAVILTVLVIGGGQDLQLFDHGNLTEFSYTPLSFVDEGGAGVKDAYLVSSYDTLHQLSLAVQDGVDFLDTTFYMADDIPVVHLDELCETLGIDVIEYRTDSSETISKAGALLLSVSVIIAIGVFVIHAYDKYHMYNA